MFTVARGSSTLKVGGRARRRRWALAFALTVTLCLAGAWLVLCGSPGLLSRSTCVLDAKDLDCEWISDTEVLTFRPQIAPTFRAIDIRTKSGRTLSELTHGFAATYAITSDGLSPNKRWIHAEGLRVSATNEFFGLAGARRSYPEDRPSKDEMAVPMEGPRSEMSAVTSAWSFDSRAWMSLNRYGGFLWFREFTVEGPKSNRQFSIKASSESSELGMVRELQNRHVLVQELRVSPIPARSFRLIEYDLNNRRLFAIHSITLPFTAEIGASALSPAGDQVAFVLTNRTVASGPIALIYSLLRRTPDPVMSLWVARLDGTGLRSLGSETLRPDRVTGTEYGLWGLKWLPGGKRVSFSFRDSLWTAPVD